MPVYAMAFGASSVFGGSVGREEGMEKRELWRSRSVSNLGDRTSCPLSPSVLGERFRTSGQNPKLRRSIEKDTGISAKNADKLPKVPRPDRAIQVFEAALNGLREHIELSRETVYEKRQKYSGSGTGTGTGTVTLGMKAEERRLKRLEYLLSKIEELSDHYFIKKKMFEGATSMLLAFSGASGAHRKQSIAQVQSGLKECTKTMCAIEAQLETLLGHFESQMKGVMGFSRVVPGDNFEAVIVHGSQKWKSRGRIIKDGSQEWDSTHKVIKVLLNETLDVKLAESKRLSKSKLGLKRCDILELFSARPQIIAVDINQTGTIKLSIMVQWNPLHDFREQMVFYNPPERLLPPPRLSNEILPVNVTYQSGTGHPSTPIGGQKAFSPSSSFVFGAVSPSPRGSSDGDSSCAGFGGLPMLPVGEEDEDEGTDDDVLVSVSFDDLEVVTVDHHSYGNANNVTSHHEDETEKNGVPMSSVSEPSPGSSASCGINIQELGEEWPVVNGLGDRGTVSSELGVSSDPPCEVVERLRDSLQEYVGRYQDLRDLEQAVGRVYTVLHDPKKYSRQSTSSVDIAIEMAFDFLNMEEEPDQGQGDLQSTRVSSVGDLPSFMESTAGKNPRSPGSTGQSLADSGVASIINRLHEEEEGHADIVGEHNSNPLLRQPTSGCVELDRVISQHCTYCETLLDNLGNVGPMRFRELESLSKLTAHTLVFTKLVAIIKVSLSHSSGPEEIRKGEAMRIVCDEGVSMGFWEDSFPSSPYSCTQEQLKDALMSCFDQALQEQYDLDSTEVFYSAVSGLIDLDTYPAEIQHLVSVTFPQICNFLVQSQFASMDEYVHHIATRLWVLDSLKSGNTVIVCQAVRSLETSRLSKDSVCAVLRLLVSPYEAISSAAETFFDHVSAHRGLRLSLIGLVIASLEDTRTDVRSGACAALEKLKIVEAVEQLSYVSQTDTSKRVQSLAKRAVAQLESE